MTAETNYFDANLRADWVELSEVERENIETQFLYALQAVKEK